VASYAAMRTTLRRAFGETVRRLRIEAGLSQEKLAEKARVSRNFEGSVDRGESSLSLDVAERFARSLKLTLAQLLVEVERSSADGAPRDSRKRIPHAARPARRTRR
jgi:transcriptional regulator with XRE-family HTH domain